LVNNQYFNTKAIVIKRRVYRESDLIVTLLTENFGKIVAIAKSAKSIRSSRGSSLQLGNTIFVQLYHKNNFYWVSETRIIDHLLKTNKKLVQLNLLFLVLEIADYLVADNQQIDGIYQQFLNMITSIESNNFYSFIKHEMDILEILGFGVPPEIYLSFSQKNYSETQSLLKKYFESILEKKLSSSELFN